MSKIPVLKVRGVHEMRIEPMVDAEHVDSAFHRILLDGKELRGVTDLTLRMGADRLASVKMKMIVNVESVNALADFRVKIDSLEQKEEGEKSGD